MKEIIRLTIDDYEDQRKLVAILSMAGYPNKVVGRKGKQYGKFCMPHHYDVVIYEKDE